MSNTQSAYEESRPNSIFDEDSLVMRHDDAGRFTKLSNSADLNTGKSYAEKTLAVSFTAGEDITSRQVIYEQGGSWRGINMYIENGQLHMNVWSVRGDLIWGYKTVSVDIEPGQDVSAVMAFTGTENNDGVMTGYLNGEAVGQADGVGILLKHTNGIGVGQVNGGTVINGKPSSGKLEFKGSVNKLVQFNEELDASGVAELNAALVEPPSPEPTPEPEPEPEPTPDPTVKALDFSEENITDYGGNSQNKNESHEVLDDGATLTISGNGWRKLAMEYSVTKDTILEFEFRVGKEGEIQGIGFDRNNSIRGSEDSSKLFQLSGTQKWGLSDFSYDGEGEWQSFQINVGEFFTGDFSYLTFANDHDKRDPDAESFFRNVKLYEAGEVVEPDPKPDPEPNPDPIADDDTAILLEDASVVINVLGNDEGEGLSVTELGAPSHGRAALNADGTVTYTANADYNGADSFTYTVTDAQGRTSTATVSLTIESVNDAPVITTQDITLTLAEDAETGLIGQVNASDIDGDTLTYAITNGNNDGLFSIDAATGEITLNDPGLDYESQTQHTLEVSVSDGSESTSTSVTIDVQDVDETVLPPIPDSKQNIVVVIDTGDFANAPDYLTMVDQYDIRMRDKDANGSNGHGKAVEKSIYDMVGPNSDTSVVHLKVASDTSTSASTSTMRRAFDYVIDNLIDVYDVVAVNLSYGSGSVNYETNHFRTQFDTLLENGTMVAIAGGNSGSYGTNHLANAPQDNVLNISATGRNGRHASYSNEGDLTDYYALGETRWHKNEDNTGSSSNIRGTSFAAPAASGLVAKVQEMAEDMFSRLLDVQEILNVFDNVSDFLTGKFTGIERNLLTLDGVVKSFSDVYDVSVAIDDDGDTKLLYKDGAYSIEKADGSVIDITKDGDIFTDQINTSWDAFQVEDNSEGGYTLVFRNQIGDHKYQKWELDSDGAFLSQSNLNSAGVRAAEKIVGVDLNNDLKIETDNGQVSVFAERELYASNNDLVVAELDGDGTLEADSGSEVTADIQIDDVLIELSDVDALLGDFTAQPQVVADDPADLADLPEALLEIAAAPMPVDEPSHGTDIL